MKKNNYKSIAKDVIQKEINGLKKLKSSLGKSFDQIIKTILGCKNGKIIVSGVGKSGIISQKWAATFSSTGTPSFFMDASSASHGDLGQISSNDVVILISLSGSSSELKNIIQFCSRNRNIKLIGITSNKKSVLYKNSDIKVLIPNVDEAGPENFVPTSSTTIQLAMGDAIAITCMKAKNFGRKDFKKYHPSGSLGVKLRTVGDIMLTNNKIPFVKEDITMEKALNEISKKGLGVLFVRKKNNTTGILTDGDIKRISQKTLNFKKIKIKSVMKKNPISVEKDTLAAKALEIMNTNRITSLCVHKNQQKTRTIGIVHIHNILNANIS
ncbi:KpsF/GutQ family sugar-phosphate isomerase [Candidatus Pelagibacter sp.]|nr:KpsF/GutQ family sugar-phosphate isomerase [Candidatus Pelagibacter sp.]